MKSATCSSGTCRNTTTDPSGRCHHHRGSSSPAVATVTLPAPTLSSGPVAQEDEPSEVEREYRPIYGIEYTADSDGILFHPEKVPAGITAYDHLGEPLTGPGPVKRKRIEFSVKTDFGSLSVSREDGPAGLYFTPTFRDGVVTERYFLNGAPFRYDGGPTVVIRRSDGSIAREEWLDTANRPHRLDGPAEIEYDVSGAVVQATYSRRGNASRIDGPYSVRPGSDGTYALGGKHFRTRDGFYRAVAKMTPATLKKHFAGTELEEISKGRETKVVAALASGVTTAEGMFEVLERDTPAEWVAAWESGAR